MRAELDLLIALMHFAFDSNHRGYIVGKGISLLFANYVNTYRSLGIAYELLEVCAGDLPQPFEPA